MNFPPVTGSCERTGSTSPRAMLRRIAMLSIPSILAGCTVGPNYKQPETDAPAAWSGPSGPNLETYIGGRDATTAPTTEPAPPTTRRVVTNQPADVASWWRTFRNPELTSLVERAVRSNIGLKQAESRVRAARASRGVVASSFYPSVDTSASYARQGDRTTSGDLYRAGLDAAWEIDIFGGLRRDIEAAEADIAAAVEDRNDVLVTLAAEVAFDYTDLRGLQRQIAIAKNNLESQRKSASLTRRLFTGGFVGRLDVSNADALVAGTAAVIPQLEQNVRQTIYALSVLLGEQPAALLDELSADAPMPDSPPEVPIGLPSELLRRRPDIRRADAQLHAATARIGVATSDLFPKFSLTGSLGLQGSQPKSLLNWGNRFWSIGPSLSWPLFDAGRMRSTIAVQNEQQEQALLAYRQTVLTAWQDVENALVSYAKEQERHEALAASVAANRQSVNLANQLYTQGQTDFLNVLSAQRSLFSSEDALVQSDRTISTNLISLYKALGGGWESQSEPSTHPTDRPE